MYLGKMNHATKHFFIYKENVWLIRICKQVSKHGKRKDNEDIIV